MIYSDGQLIYIFSKVRERYSLMNHISEEFTTPFRGITVTNN